MSREITHSNPPEIPEHIEKQVLEMRDLFNRSVLVLGQDAIDIWLLIAVERMATAAHACSRGKELSTREVSELSMECGDMIRGKVRTATGLDMVN